MTQAQARNDHYILDPSTHDKRKESTVATKKTSKKRKTTKTKSRK